VRNIAPGSRTSVLHVTAELFETMAIVGAAEEIDATVVPDALDADSTWVDTFHLNLTDGCSRDRRYKM
jgi:hypothetical protein